VTHTITLDPETFPMVKVDAAELLAIAEEAATAAGVADDVSIAIEVDEALPHPLIAHMSWIADDGSVGLWFSGGTFEDPQHQAMLHPANSKAELTGAFLRARDRLDGGFEDAPPDGELSERQRAIWDVYTEGRIVRLGCHVNEPRRRYSYRLRAGFNDVADAEYEQLWAATALTWAQLSEIEERLAAADPRPATKKPLRNPSLRVS
jgi:hypothetical protein